MRVTIVIETDNAAFGDGTLEEARPELVKILGKLGHYVATQGICCPDRHALLDSNGNTCGHVEYTK